VPRRWHISGYPCPGDTLDENLRGPIGLARNLENAGDDADAMEVARSGLLGF
jgi:hypothetical protein